MAETKRGQTSFKLRDWLHFQGDITSLIILDPQNLKLWKWWFPRPGSGLPHGGFNSPRLQGWGFDHSVRIIISILYTANALYVSTTSRVSPTWYLKVGYLGRMDGFQQRWVCSNAIHYFMVTVIWRSSHPNKNVQAKGMKDPCFASENLGLRFVENMREKSTPLSCLMPYGGPSCHPSSDFPAPKCSNIIQTTCELLNMHCATNLGQERYHSTTQQSRWFPQNCT